MIADPGTPPAPKQRNSATTVHSGISLTQKTRRLAPKARRTRSPRHEADTILSRSVRHDAALGTEGYPPSTWTETRTTSAGEALSECRYVTSRWVSSTSIPSRKGYFALEKTTHVGNLSVTDLLTHGGAPIIRLADVSSIFLGGENRYPSMEALGEPSPPRPASTHIRPDALQ